MRLYHGSNVIVNKPVVLPPEAGKTVDFGVGFYTTTSYDQAERWVGIRHRRGELASGFVSCYEIPDDLLANPHLKCLSLTLFEIGQLDVEETIRRLKTYTLVDQYLFHTEKALSYLKFIGSEVVRVRQ